MSLETGTEGIAYTETTVYSVPEAYVKDAPYQLAIVELVPAYGIRDRHGREAARTGDSRRTSDGRRRASFRFWRPREF